MYSVTLRPRDLDAEQRELEQQEQLLDERERELFALKLELQQLQARYLADVGGLYRELTSLEATVTAAEVQAGLRPPPSPYDSSQEDDDRDGSAESCTNPSSPSVDLKRIFRDVARAIHPDRALDEPARCRRHSLMAEANRAYAERDEDRLRLILSTWERSPDAVVGDGREADEQRVQRRLAEIGERLQAIDAETRDLHASAIWRLKSRVDEARAQGWDLFAEMRLQVKREIARARVRLARLGVDAEA